MKIRIEGMQYNKPIPVLLTPSYSGIFLATYSSLVVTPKYTYAPLLEYPYSPVKFEPSTLRCSRLWCRTDSFPAARENWRFTMSFVINLIPPLEILSNLCLLLLILNLKFFQFSLATGVNLCGSMRMFGLWLCRCIVFDAFCNFCLLCSLHRVSLASFLLAAHRQHWILSSNFLASCLCFCDVWFKAYNAQEWWGGPETGGSCLWISSMPMANPSRSSHPKWRWRHNYCTHGIWEVNDLLDAIVIHKTRDYCCGYPIETTWRPVCGYATGQQH